jgi:hypothetical protein
MSTTTDPKTQVQTTADAIPAISIPGAVLPGTTPPAAKPNLKDRMKGLKSAPKTDKPAASKRPEYDAPKEAVEAIRRFIPADTIRKIAEKRAENANAEASEILFKAFCAALWKNKAVPANPKVVVRDGNDQPEMSAIFQVQDRFSPNAMKLPEIKPEMEEEDAVAVIIATLVEAGLEKADAEKFVAAEVETTKKRNIRSLNELALGHYGADKQWVEASPEEQSVAAKLMDFLDTLTDAEQALIRRDEMRISVKKDTLARVCQYAHCAPQVEAILKVFQPVNFISHSVLGIAEDEATKIKKLQDAANEMIGSVEVK